CKFGTDHAIPKSGLFAATLVNDEVNSPELALACVGNKGHNTFRFFVCPYFLTSLFWTPICSYEERFAKSFNDSCRSGRLFRIVCGFGGERSGPSCLH